MRAGVAAGHPATAEVGAEILSDGGTAADAVVAMALASCVAETVMSGLFAGCHAIAFDGSRASNLDGFAAIPSGLGDMEDVPVPFGDELVAYSIGPASCAVPGPPRRARRALGAARPPAVAPPRRARPRAREVGRSAPRDARTLALTMLADVFSRGRGSELFLRDGRTLRDRRAARATRSRARRWKRFPRRERRPSTAARSRRRCSASTASSSTPTTCAGTAPAGATPSSSRSTATASRRGLGSRACPSCCRASLGSPG